MVDVPARVVGVQLVGAEWALENVIDQPSEIKINLGQVAQFYDHGDEGAKGVMRVTMTLAFMHPEDKTERGRLRMEVLVNIQLPALPDENNLEPVKGVFNEAIVVASSVLRVETLRILHAAGAQRSLLLLPKLLEVKLSVLDVSGVKVIKGTEEQPKKRQRKKKTE